jgi:hypothetical protein
VPLGNDEPLDPSWVAAFDEEGNDLALAAELAAMTPEQRAESEANWRAAVEEARANLRPRLTKRDDARSV